MKLNKYILDRAEKAGICPEWAQKITDAKGIDDLLDMYVRGIDFCFEKNFPSPEDLLKFGSNHLAAHGIFIDECIGLANVPVVVLLKECDANISFHNFSVGQLYVRHTSKAKIICENNAFVVIDCFDESQVEVVGRGNSKVMVNVYGKARVIPEEKDHSIIKIVHKNKTTY